MINRNAPQPLADRLRPATLDEFIGQKHLVGEGKPLYQAIKNRRLHSMIFWGPPGVGKTTLAGIIADQMRMEFHALSAVSAGKNDIREVVEAARGHSTPMDRLLDAGADPKRGAILFLDEIHRFNKAQQDYLLPFVEDGTLTLIGATTENPSFEVIPALLSRCRVYVLEALNEDDVRQLVERGAQALNVTLEDEAADFLIRFANGDGRQTLNLLETAAELYTTDQDRALTLDDLKEALQSRHLRYDKASEEHYNTISAYIKSMRASDPDAALYYLARMVAAGEDPKFIARRMVIFASEDVGMAQPTALVVANEVFRAVETIGYPECQINLAHGTVYLATAAKDRSAYEGYFEALDDVNAHGNLSIPMQLRNAPTPLMKQLGYGKAEDEPTANLLPDKLKNRRYYKAKGSSK
jgi:putative ATPase